MRPTSRRNGEEDLEIFQNLLYQDGNTVQICSYYKRQFHFLLPRPCPEEMAGGRGFKIFWGGFHGSRNRLSEQFFEIRPLSQDMGTLGGPLQGQKMVKNFFSIFFNFWTESPRLMS